ncbi:Histone deacetylase superfamily [Perkinsela sp. CCAP 1560/4]|nr:Histone deacetylase superfamily [Perkinsela sp. CCAP 1560/4]|eukprot:KNH07460.1 Histone deacetylase superfamily [Perkinsela sp. CCAP 1560/4]
MNHPAAASEAQTTRNDVVMMWDDAIPHYTYCPNACHPMKPLRLQLLHRLLEKLDVLKHLCIMKPPAIDRAQLEAYHAPEYLQFLIRESSTSSRHRLVEESRKKTEHGGTRLEVYENLRHVEPEALTVNVVNSYGSTEINTMDTLLDAIRSVRKENRLDETDSESGEESKPVARGREFTQKQPRAQKKRAAEVQPPKLGMQADEDVREEQSENDEVGADTDDMNCFFRLSGDCPPFDGLYDYSAHIASGSVAGAVLLNTGTASTVINWAGGLHHAHRFEAAGFCYVNDIVLSIIELLKVFERVLYVDIDIHHGDGVEEAFIASDRVMTISFHRHGFDGFFPGTGWKEDIGVGPGEGFALNVPLYDGVRDDQFYFLLFKPILRDAIDRFAPQAIVMQCGADSISGDRIGRFNLSSAGHARCVALVKSLHLPTLILGGGGYTMTNVARTWALETALLSGAAGVHELSIIPAHDFDVYYSSVPRERVLGVQEDVTMGNENAPSYIEHIRALSIEQLRGLPTRAYDHKSFDDASTD